MKLFKRFCVGLALVAAIGPRWGFAATRVDGTALLNETAITYSTATPPINTDVLNSLSLTATYSTASVAAVSLVDGRLSTATITVSDNNSLVAKAAGFSVRVASNNPVGGTLLTITTPLQSYKFKSGAGGNWNYVDTSSGSCQALAAAINADPSGLFVASCPFAVNFGTVCFSSAAVAGAGANSWTVSSSSVPALSTGNVVFTGGLDNSRVNINGVTLIQGVDWTKGVTSSDSAKSMSDAAMARTGISSVIVTTWTAAGIVFATATTPGVNAYALYTSTSGALRLNTSAVNNTDTMNGGVLSNIVASTFTKNNALTLGMAVLFSTVTGTPPANLTNQTTYFVIPLPSLPTSFRLATSSANALAGTAINVSTFTGNGSFTLTPLPLTVLSNNGFKFQVSNDLTNWFDLGVSSVTLTSTLASTSFWDLGTPTYRWLRAFFVGPTTGGYAVTISANGRQN